MSLTTILEDTEKEVIKPFGWLESHGAQVNTAITKAQEVLTVGSAVATAAGEPAAAAALGDQAGKAAVDEIIKQLPVEQQFIANIVQLLVDSVKSDIVEGVTALADGISQIVQLGEALDGATISFEMEPIIVKAKFTVNTPLRPIK